MRKIYGKELESCKRYDVEEKIVRGVEKTGVIKKNDGGKRGNGERKEMQKCKKLDKGGIEWERGKEK